MADKSKTFTALDNKPTYTDLNNLKDDIQTAGQARNLGGYGITNCAGVTDPNGLTLVYKTNSAYDFAAITPAQTLTASTPATVTLSPYPSGITASSPNIHKLRIVDAVGGDEVITLTAVNVGTSVTFTPALNHTSGNWTIQSATDGIQEGILALGTGGWLPIKAGTSDVYGQITIPFPFTLTGAKGQSKIAVHAGASETWDAISFAGALTATNTTVSVSANSDRANSWVSSLTFTSTAGFSVGDYVLLRDTYTADDDNGPGHEYMFRQLNRIRGIAGSVVTFEYPVKIPMVVVTSPAVHDNGIYLLTIRSNVHISGLTFDGSDAATATAVCAISGVYAAHCSIQDVTCEDFSTKAAVFLSDGYFNYAGRVKAIDSGSAGYNDLCWYGQTAMQCESPVSLDAAVWPMGFYYCVGGGVSNPISQGGKNGRALKIAGAAWMNFNNLDFGYAMSGLSLSGGTCRCNFNNLTGGLATGGGYFDIYFAGENSIHNVFNNLQLIGGASGQIGLGITDTDNVFSNVNSPTTVVDNGSRNSFSGRGIVADQAVTLANGANHDIAIPPGPMAVISGPTGGFSVSGFAKPYRGRTLTLLNATGQQMTITNNAGSVAANRIITLTGADVVLRAGNSAATFFYDTINTFWVLTATN